MAERVFTQTFGVVGALLEKDGRILLIKESQGVDQGKWNHPAGWIDVGEDPIQAAQREVLEESGFDLKLTHLLGVYSLVRADLKNSGQGVPHAIKLIFTGSIQNPDSPHPLHDDVSETKWFDPEEIYAMDGNTLRDVDIKQIVRDYFAGKGADLSIVVHTVQNS